MCLPADLPTVIDVDIENLDLGQALHLSDLELPEGVLIVALSGEERDTPVVSIQAPRGGLEDEEAELGEEALLEREEETPDEAKDSASGGGGASTG